MYPARRHSLKSAECFSLSPRERVGVRGNGANFAKNASASHALRLSHTRLRQRAIESVREVQGVRINKMNCPIRDAVGAHRQPVEQVRRNLDPVTEPIRSRVTRMEETVRNASRWW